MKNSIYTVLAFALLGNVAGAQKVIKFENGNLALQSCYGTEEGIQCDFTYRLTDRNSAILSLTPEHYEGTTETGAKVASYISLDGSDFTSRYDRATANVRSSTPIKVAMFFNLPSNSKNVSITKYGGPFQTDTLFSKIPVRPYGTPAPTTKAPAASAPATVNVDSGSYNAVLSNCKKQGTSLYCNAVLTPRK